MPEEPTNSLESRDASTAFILGGFFLLFSLPVLAGTFYSELSIDRIINVCAGLIIMAVGMGFVLRGNVLRRRVRGRRTD